MHASLRPNQRYLFLATRPYTLSRIPFVITLKTHIQFHGLGSLRQILKAASDL